MALGHLQHAAGAQHVDVGFGHAQLEVLLIAGFAQPGRIERSSGGLDTALDAPAGIERQRRHGLVGSAVALGERHFERLPEKLGLRRRRLVEGGIARLQRDIGQAGGLRRLQLLKAGGRDLARRLEAAIGGQGGLPRLRQGFGRALAGIQQEGANDPTHQAECRAAPGSAEVGVSRGERRSAGYSTLIDPARICLQAA
jgi:hypothetical protein